MTAAAVAHRAGLDLGGGLEPGYDVSVTSNPTSKPSRPTDPPDPGAGPDAQAVEAILDRIRPAVQSDGGDVELVGVREDGVVEVRLLGACIGCPSSQITLKHGIERSLVAHVPGVTAVEQVA